MASVHQAGATPSLGPERSRYDEARTTAPTVPGLLVVATSDTGDFPCRGLSEQAALTIEGEAYARAYLSRLHAGTATAEELATILAFLGGEMLYGACRVIEKALEARHA